MENLPRALNLEQAIEVQYAYIKRLQYTGASQTSMLRALENLHKLKLVQIECNYPNFTGVIPMERCPVIMYYGDEDTTEGVW